MSTLLEKFVSRCGRTLWQAGFGITILTVLASSSLISWAASTPVVKLYDATGRESSADLAKKRLGEAGFEQVQVSPGTKPVSKSSILCRQEHEKAGRRVAKALGLGETCRLSSKTKADIVVVLGPDFEPGVGDSYIAQRRPSTGPGTNVWIGGGGIPLGWAVGKPKGSPSSTLAEKFNYGMVLGMERGRGRWRWGGNARLYSLDAKEGPIGTELDAQMLVAVTMARFKGGHLFGHLLAGPSILLPAVGTTNYGLNAGMSAGVRWSQAKGVKIAGKRGPRVKPGVLSGITYRASAYFPDGFEYSLFHRLVAELALDLAF